MSARDSFWVDWTTIRRELILATFGIMSSELNLVSVIMLYVYVELHALLLFYGSSTHTYLLESS